MNFCTTCRYAYKSTMGTPLRCLNVKAQKIDWDYVKGVCEFPEPSRVRGRCEHCELWEPMLTPWERIVAWMRSVRADLY